MPRREDEYWAGRKESRGTPLCPRCGSPKVYYNRHYRSWRCGRCESSFPTPSYGTGHVRGHIDKSIGSTVGRLRSRRHYLSGEPLVLLLLTLVAIGIIAYTYYHISQLDRPVAIGIMVAAAAVALGNATMLRRLWTYKTRRVGCGIMVTALLLVVLIGCSAAAYTKISPLYEAKNAVVEWLHKSGSSQGNGQPPTGPLTSKPPTSTPTPKSTPSHVINLSELERLTFSLINSERIAQGLSPLQWSDSIASVARNHSVDMADHGYFAHEDLQGKDMGDRLQNAGISWHMCAENIGCVPAVKTYHYVNGILVSKDSYTMEQLAEEAVSSWMASPGHRANILNTGYAYSGLGVGRGIQDGQDSFLFTQDFVSP